MREIEALERELQAAVAARDMEALERLLGQEFTLTTGRPGHEVRGRAEYLEVTATRYVIEEFRFDERGRRAGLARRSCAHATCSAARWTARTARSLFS